MSLPALKSVAFKLQVVVPNESKHLTGRESRAALQAEVEPLARTYVTPTPVQVH